MFLWIRLNSELLRYQGVQNFAKNNTENAELASKMLKQQHFLYQRKTCTTRNLHEVLQARTYQRNICENFAWFLYYPCSHRTLFWSSGWCHWRQWPDISAEREPVGHPWQFKVKKMKDMRERNFLILINWIMEGWCLVHSGRELLCAGTLNVCEAFVMTCRQAAVIKPTVWGVAEFGRLAANKRMHGVENAVLFNVPAHMKPFP